MQKRMYDADTISNAVGVTAKIHQKLYPMGHQPMSGQGSAESVPMAMETMEGHCLGSSCRDGDGKPSKKTFNVEGEEKMKNGTIRKYGKCPDCGTNISHLISGKAAA